MFPTTGLLRTSCVSNFFYSRLASVIVRAQHLTVVSRCLSTLVPRGDMVALHFFKLKVPFADRADAFLLVCFSFLIIGENSDAEMPFFSIQDE